MTRNVFVTKNRENDHRSCCGHIVKIFIIHPRKYV